MESIAVKMLETYLKKQRYKITDVGSTIISVGGKNLDGVAHITISPIGEIHMLYTQQAFVYDGYETQPVSTVHLKGNVYPVSQVVTNHVIHEPWTVADPNFLKKIGKFLPTVEQHLNVNH